MEVSLYVVRYIELGIIRPINYRKINMIWYLFKKKPLIHIILLLIDDNIVFVCYEPYVLLLVLFNITKCNYSRY